MNSVTDHLLSRLSIKKKHTASAPLLLPFTGDGWMKMRWEGEDEDGGMSWQALAYWGIKCHMCSEWWKNFTSHLKAPQTIFQNIPLSCNVLDTTCKLCVIVSDGKGWWGLVQMFWRPTKVKPAKSLHYCICLHMPVLSHDLNYKIKAWN